LVAVTNPAPNQGQTPAERALPHVGQAALAKVAGIDGRPEVRYHQPPTGLEDAHHLVHGSQAPLVVAHVTLIDIVDGHAAEHQVERAVLERHRQHVAGAQLAAAGDALRLEVATCGVRIVAGLIAGP
jgi:hypothetical protein